MKKYHVVIEETVSDTFEVEATSKENAISAAIREYNAGNFVVGSDNVEHRQISVVDDDGELTDWVEF
ncbi:MAG: hypothetical protein IJ774_07175 [Selenomonadaceae bacterium]|nr:hypothetical protein [Selenomonadaceae bacterium]